MSPFVFVALAFVFTIANRLYGKYALFRLDGYALALVSNALGALYLFPFIYTQLPSLAGISSSQIFILISLGLLWTYVAWAGNLSIAQNDFSFKEIIRQTRIIWVVLIGVLFLGEHLAFKEYFGIALIIGSVYVISWRHISWREHVSSKPVLLAWSVALSAAAIAILEKIILKSFSVPTYAFLAYLMPTVCLLLFLNSKRISATAQLMRVHYKETLIVSVLMVLSYFTALYAYKLLPISLAYPLVQSSTVVGVLIGTYLFEHKKGWTRKLFATLLAVCGILIIQLS